MNMVYLRDVKALKHNATLHQAKDYMDMVYLRHVKALYNLFLN